MRSRRKPDEDEARMAVAETGNGFSPVFTIPVRALFVATDLFGIRSQLRTAAARHHRAFDLYDALHDAESTSAYSMPIGAITYATPSLRCQIRSTALRE